MQEITHDILAYVKGNPILYLGLGFVAGFLATRTVASERRPGVIGFWLIGMLGIFLSHFIIAYYGLRETLDNVGELRILFDLIAAYIGSLVVAALVHFIKPN